MALNPYIKPHATAHEHITHLRCKGLCITQPDIAAAQIDFIGYERLRIYFLSRRQNDIDGRPFRPETSFSDIISLYECDIQIREKCFSAVSQFELLFRNSLSEALSSNFGGHPNFEINAFQNTNKRLKTLKIFTDIYEKSKDPRAKHYCDNYSAPSLPPIWTLKEFLTFGTLSHIYKNLSGQIKTEIASKFGVPTDQIFSNWINCLVDLRNQCAHHDRIFNRSFQKQPKTLRSESIPKAQGNKLKAILECLDYMLEKRGTPRKIVSEVSYIINQYSAIKAKETGF